MKAVSILELPTGVLEHIFGYLSYSRAGEMREVCKRFSEVSANVLKYGFLKVSMRIDRQMSILKDEMLPERGKTQARRIQLFYGYQTLKIVRYEMRMVAATCWRYVKVGACCFFAGDLLDDFDEVYHMVKSGSRVRQLEPVITSRIYFKTEKFMDYFEKYVEPLVEDSTPLGTRIVDILNCCASSNLFLCTTSSEESSRVVGYYELHDVSTIDSVPETFPTDALSGEIKTFDRYVRNNVHWNNLFFILKEMWDAEGMHRRREDFDRFLLREFKIYSRKEEKVVSGGVETTKTYRRYVQPVGKMAIICKLDMECNSDEAPIEFEELEDIVDVAESPLEEEERDVASRFLGALKNAAKSMGQTHGMKRYKLSVELSVRTPFIRDGGSEIVITLLRSPEKTIAHRRFVKLRGL